MDVLITFYIEGELSTTLKTQVEEHIKKCAECKAKFDIIKSMINDLKKDLNLEDNLSEDNFKTKVVSQQYRVFKNNLSAYIDNELSNDDNIKIKKFTINNEKARQDLQDNYNIKKLMNNSFIKTKSEARQDFSRSVLRQLEFEEENGFGIHPAIKVLIGFTISVLVLTSIVLMSLSV
jgi:anti-sigma factor RsiW